MHVTVAQADFIKLQAEIYYFRQKQVSKGLKKQVRDLSFLGWSLGIGHCYIHSYNFYNPNK